MTTQNPNDFMDTLVHNLVGMKRKPSVKKTRPMVYDPCLEREVEATTPESVLNDYQVEDFRRDLKNYINSREGDQE